LRWIKIKVKDAVKLIPVDRVYFFKSEDKYTKVVTKNQEFLIRKPLYELAEELNPEFFWRIHRGTIINANMIDSISTSVTGRGLVKLKNRSEFHTVSRSYSHIFKQM
jgi:DNA-binding LytR/AlgR family response regulator